MVLPLSDFSGQQLHFLPCPCFPVTGSSVKGTVRNSHVYYTRGPSILAACGCARWACEQAGTMRVLLWGLEWSWIKAYGRCSQKRRWKLVAFGWLFKVLFLRSRKSCFSVSEKNEVYTQKHRWKKESGLCVFPTAHRVLILPDPEARTFLFSGSILF